MRKPAPAPHEALLHEASPHEQGQARGSLSPQRHIASTATSTRHAGRTAFVVLVLGLLGGSLVCLLVVNTTLAANSIKIDGLQQANATNSQRMQELQQQVASARSATVIEQEAWRLGMRPDGPLTFLDLRNHSILSAGSGLTPVAPPSSASQVSRQRPSHKRHGSQRSATLRPRHHKPRGSR